MAREADAAQGPIDWTLLGATLALAALGLMMVYSSTSDMGYRLHGDAAYFFKRQALWLIFGLGLMGVAAWFPYHHWKRLSIPLMAVALLALIALAILREGRLLWKQSISPVELAKLAMIIYIGHWLSSKGSRVRQLSYGLLPFTIIVGVIAGLVVAQPDMSEALVIVLVAVAMFFLAGADPLQFLVGIVSGSVAFYFVIEHLPHAMERIKPYLQEIRDPLHSTNLQLSQGLLALSSGGFTGFGPGEGRMKYLWLPAAHTDSIFAIIGEELGLVGSLLLIGLFALLVYRGLRLAVYAPDPFARLLAAGFSLWIGFQALINMAVVTGTIPYTGITLPFISVGGSSLVACLVGVGITLNISRAVNAQEAVRARRRPASVWRPASDADSRT